MPTIELMWAFTSPWVQREVQKQASLDFKITKNFIIFKNRIRTNKSYCRKVLFILISIKLGTCTHKMLKGKVTYKNHYQISGLFRSTENLPDCFLHSDPSALTITKHSIRTDSAFDSPNIWTTGGWLDQKLLTTEQQ